jgi:hypothetical protein
MTTMVDRSGGSIQNMPVIVEALRGGETEWWVLNLGGGDVGTSPRGGRWSSP